MEERVVGFGGSGGEKNAFGVGVEDVGELFAGFFKVVFHRRGFAIEAGGVVPGLIGGKQPGFACSGMQRGGGVVVEVSGHGVSGTEVQ